MTSRYMPLDDWLQIEASAPGRFILSGEYADLYEKNAIAVAIDCRTKVVIKRHKEGRLRLNLKSFNSIREWTTTSFTMTRLVAKYADVLDYSETMPLRLNHLLHKRWYYQKEPLDTNPDLVSESAKEVARESVRQADNGTMAFLILYVALGDSYAWSARPSLDIEVESNMPIGRGLGSSSAYGVAMCAALMKVFRVSAEPYVISDWALSIDKFFHGMASGLNTSVIVHGGYIYFQHNKMKAHGIPHLSPIKVMLIDTGIRRDPRLINSMVAEQLLDQSHRVNTIFNNISDQAYQTWRKFNDPHFAPRSIASYLQTNQELLDSLGLGHERLVDICTKGQLLNLAVKQTQAGETAFLLFDELDNCRHIVAFRNELTELGYTFENHDINCKGLDVIITPDPAASHLRSKAK